MSIGSGVTPMVDFCGLVSFRTNLIVFSIILHNFNNVFFILGFGENSRVLKWIFERVDGKQDVRETPVGLLPVDGSIDLKGLSEKVDMKELMSVPSEYWLEQLDDIERYYTEQFGEDLPNELWDEVNSFRERLSEKLSARAA